MFRTQGAELHACPTCCFCTGWALILPQVHALCTTPEQGTSLLCGAGQGMPHMCAHSIITSVGRWSQCIMAVIRVAADGCCWPTMPHQHLIAVCQAGLCRLCLHHDGPYALAAVTSPTQAVKGCGNCVKGWVPGTALLAAMLSISA
jgi:hypothetical protein